MAISTRNEGAMRRTRTGIGLGIGAAAAAALAFGLLGGLGHRPEARAADAPPAAAQNAGIPVPVVAVVKRTVPVYLDYVGTTEAIRSVALQAKVTGYLAERGAPDGADVKQGDLLYRIDPRDYQAVLEQIKAQAQRDAAALEYSRSNQRRSAALSKDGWVAKDAFDQTTSTLHQGEATLAADQAAIQTAQLNLGYTEIRAPFAGRLSRSLAHEGTLISAAGTQLNTLVQIDPIYATFNPPETALATIEKYRAAGKIPVELLLTGDTEPRFRGSLTFLDNTVDRATGTITARATIDNSVRTLLPGQYVRVRLHVTDQPDALLIPQIALGSSQIGKFVYVVGDGNKAEQRFVTLGATQGAQIIVASGVKEGESVITGNLQKIGPGAPVQPKPAEGSGGT
jgi:multidrug efflux system membrane fusion protein